MYVNAFITGKDRHHVPVTPLEAVYYVESLNKNDSIYVHIFLESEKRLSILAGHSWRRKVIAFNLPDSQGTLIRGLLIDTEVVSSTEGIYLYLEGKDGPPDYVRKRETVPIERALEVVKFYLENGYLPENTHWEAGDPEFFPMPELPPDDD